MMSESLYKLLCHSVIHPLAHWAAPPHTLTLDECLVEHIYLFDTGHAHLTHIVQYILVLFLIISRLNRPSAMMIFNLAATVSYIYDADALRIRYGTLC